MKQFFSDPVTRFRYVAYAEGISFLLLLLIAMPLKYMAGIPEGVKYIGWAHGLLFVLYLALVMEVRSELQWSFGKVLMALVASVLPFGPFIIDRKLIPARAAE